ncbi:MULTISPECIES: hypothetical protein [Alistipes]|uniref:Uncharacterized protein n=1 Tax=Alistipes putredinis DSM 17216 TaxID=445970 RepID=B0MVZ6_9BACT|nr:MULTISPECIES: hypothetical protein [Alistipes]EDS03465.1 hypothetical protein ALIPUT_01285 [Alistipes putredinis DSM 17216]
MKKLLLLCLLLGVSIGAFAQVDTLSPITPPSAAARLSGIWSG